MNILFKVREFVWVIVSEIEDWVYPYRTRLTEEEKYEHGMKDPMTGEITMIENLLQADNERIQRLQDEMINAQNRLYDIEQTIKSINTYSQNKSNQSIQMKDKKAAKKLIQRAKLNLICIVQRHVICKIIKKKQK